MIINLIITHNFLNISCIMRSIKLSSNICKFEYCNIKTYLQYVRNPLTNESFSSVSMPLKKNVDGMQSGCVYDNVIGGGEKIHLKQITRPYHQSYNVRIDILQKFSVLKGFELTEIQLKIKSNNIKDVEYAAVVCNVISCFIVVFTY